MARTSSFWPPMDFEAFRNALVSPALRAVVAHWDEARAGAPMPSWSQIRPARIAKYLPQVWAFKLDAESGQFVGRLAGQNVARAYDRNIRGLRLDEIMLPEQVARIHPMMKRLISEPVVYRRAGDLFRYDGRTFEGERINLPLASDGIHGDGLLGVSVYDCPHYNANRGPVEIFVDSPQWFAMPKVEPGMRQ